MTFASIVKYLLSFSNRQKIALENLLRVKDPLPSKFIIIAVKIHLKMAKKKKKKKE